MCLLEYNVRTIFLCVNNESSIIINRRREWSIDGVNTVSSVVNSTTGRATVHCQSFHLTAFAVLVDVSGTITVIIGD